MLFELNKTIEKNIDTSLLLLNVYGLDSKYPANRLFSNQLVIEYMKMFSLKNN